MDRWRPRRLNLLTFSALSLLLASIAAFIFVELRSLPALSETAHDYYVQPTKQYGTQNEIEFGYSTLVDRGVLAFCGFGQYPGRPKGPLFLALVRSPSGPWVFPPFASISDDPQRGMFASFIYADTPLNHKAPNQHMFPFYYIVNGPPYRDCLMVGYRLLEIEQKKGFIEPPIWLLDLVMNRTYIPKRGRVIVINFDRSDLRVKQLDLDLVELLGTEVTAQGLRAALGKLRERQADVRDLFRGVD